MIKLMICIVLLLMNVVTLIFTLIQGGRWLNGILRHADVVGISTIAKRSICLLAVSILLILAYVAITQMIAYTPRIKDSDGKVVDGSISSLEKVTLNGREEWISIRGENKEAPVLLFLAGGPGGTQMSYSKIHMKELEKSFVVVSWDQPGSGKSYYSTSIKKLTPDVYIEDGLSLTEYLMKRFGKNKIYLMGESWGSGLGIFMASRKPEYYHGFIGVGQMIDFEGTDTQNYEMAMEIATEKGDTAFASKLEKLGPPPYTTGNYAMKSNTYISYLSAEMGANPEIYGHFDMIQEIFSSEYGILDSVNYLMGLINTYGVVYPQLYGIDLRNDYNKMEIPVYIFVGRYDINAPTDFVEDYVEKLDAPEKELVWFEHSGHGIPVCEPERFAEETLRVFGLSKND